MIFEIDLTITFQIFVVMIISLFILNVFITIRKTVPTIKFSLEKEKEKLDGSKIEPNTSIISQTPLDNSNKPKKI